MKNSELLQNSIIYFKDLSIDNFKMLSTISLHFFWDTRTNFGSLSKSLIYFFDLHFRMQSFNFAIYYFQITFLGTRPNY